MIVSRRLLLAAPVAHVLSLPAFAAQAQEPPPSPPLIPPAYLDDGLEIDGDPIDAQRRRSRLYIDVVVGGQGPFRFLVDTGADRSAIGSALAQRLGLKVAGLATLQSMAGPSQVQTVVVESLRLGRTDTGRLVLPALPELHLGAEGLIGIDAMADSRILLDYENRAVTVQDSNTRVETNSEEIVVTARRKKGQLILTEVNLQDQRLYAVIDSGSEISVGNLALARRLDLNRPLPDMQQIELISVTGDRLLASVAILPTLRVGSFLIRNLAVAFVDAAPFKLFGLSNQPALLLGSDALQVFRRVALDFGRRRVRFTLPR